MCWNVMFSWNSTSTFLELFSELSEFLDWISFWHQFSAWPHMFEDDFQRPLSYRVSCWALKCQSTILAHVAQLLNGALEEISHTHSGSPFTVKQSFTLPQLWLKHQRPSSPRCVSWPRAALLHGHFIYMLNTKHNTVQREFKPVPQRFWPVKHNKCASGRKVLSFTDGEADNAIPCRDDAQRWIIVNGNIRQITDCQRRPNQASPRQILNCFCVQCVIAPPLSHFVWFSG